MLRVLLMARELGLGGSERQLCEIAKSLDRSRFEPHAGCLREGGIRAEELRAAGVPVVRFPVRSFMRSSALRGAWEMGRYLREHRISIVHTFDVPMNEFGVPVGRAFGAPLVLSSQRAHRDLVRAIDRLVLRATDLMVDGIVVNSLAVRRRLLEEDRVPAGALHLCYNGIDTARFRPGPRRGDAALAIGVVCAFRREKDLPTLLEAFARVRGAHNGLKLVLVGDGPVAADLRAEAARLGLGDSCRFEPATADVPAWLRAIDIFVLPSISEAFSNSLMEAMACGCAVIASSTGGNPELVAHGRNGLLFPPGDAAALAECLRRLIEDDGLRTSLSAAASAHIHQNFSLAASTRRMEEIYTELMRRKAGITA